MILSIPYSFFNGIPVGDCGVEYLTLNIDNYGLCGEKPFALQINGMPVIDGVKGVSFLYDGDTYITTTLTPDETIRLLATAFTCPNSSCSGQEASFNWELSPLVADKWTSTTILNDVSPSNVVYSFDDITVNGVTYTPLPHVFWDDTINGNASEHAYDFMQAIIDYIVSLSIPEYVGAVNNGTNGVADNLQGVGLLDLYFETGTTVSIDISAPAPVISGTFTGGISTVIMLLLEMTDTSTMAMGDVLTLTTWTVMDNTNQIINSTTPVCTIVPYNIFCNGCGLNEKNNWVISEVITTQNICVVNNVAYGYITIAQIADALAGNTVTGISVN